MREHLYLSIFILEQGVYLEEQGGDRVGVSPHQGGEGREGASVQGESVLENKEWKGIIFPAINCKKCYYSILQKYCR